MGKTSWRSSGESAALFQEPGTIFTFNNSLLLFFDFTKGQAFGLLRFVDEPGVGCNTPTGSRPLDDQCRPANHHQINKLLVISPVCNQYFIDRQNCSVKGLLLPNQTRNGTNNAAERGPEKQLHQNTSASNMFHFTSPLLNRVQQQKAPKSIYLFNLSFKCLTTEEIQVSLCRV